MSKMLFIFGEFDRAIIDEKDPAEAQDVIETAFNVFMEEIYGSWTVHFSQMETTEFGFENPEAIVHAAENWNSSLRENFETALKEYRESNEALDTQETFKLRMAVSALDDFFSPVMECFVFENKENTTYTIMPDQTLAYIKEHPEMCAIVYLSCC